MRPPTQKFVGATAVVGSGLALGACALCCVLPLAIPAIATVLGAAAISWLEASQTWSTPVAGGLVATSWLWIDRQSASARRRPAGLTLAAMGVATLLAASALAWPIIEPVLIKLLQP